MLHIHLDFRNLCNIAIRRKNSSVEGNTQRFADHPRVQVAYLSVFSHKPEVRNRVFKTCRELNFDDEYCICTTQRSRSCKFLFTVIWSTSRSLSIAF